MEAFETQLLAAVRDRPVGEPLVAAFARFVLQPRGFLAAEDENAARYLTAVSRMIAASPALLSREREILARYTASLAALIAENTAAEPGDLRPWVVAHALIGTHQSLTEFVRRRPAGRPRQPRPPRPRGRSPGPAGPGPARAGPGYLRCQVMTAERRWRRVDPDLRDTERIQAQGARTPWRGPRSNQVPPQHAGGEVCRWFLGICWPAAAMWRAERDGDDHADGNRAR